RERRGHGHQAQRVPRGSRVHHHLVEPARKPPQLGEPDQLVHSRQREPEEGVDVLVVEVRSPRGDDAERSLARSEPARERAVGVHLRREQLPVDGPRRGGEPHFQRVAQRVRGIRRDQQRSFSSAREREGSRRGAGRLPRAALARIEAEHHSCSKSAVASTPTTLYSPDSSLGAASPPWRLRISRRRGSSSASNRANSSSVISPSSSRIWAASSSSRRRESSFSSASTAAAILPSTNLIPPRSILSTISKRLLLLRPLQLQADVDEVIRRPGPRVLEGELVEAG